MTYEYVRYTYIPIDSYPAHINVMTFSEMVQHTLGLVSVEAGEDQPINTSSSSKNA